MEQMFFLLLAGVAIGSGLLVVLARDPIHCALALVVCLIQVAAVFILLGSPFLAVIQIFVYVGAVMVLFLFVIMMLDVRKEADTRFQPRGRPFILLVLVLLGSEILFLLFSGASAVQPDTALATVRVVPVEDLSLLLFQDFLLPFEIASIILLVALVGAVVLARKEPV